MSKSSDNNGTSRRNPVAKHAPEFCKPKTFTDRKDRAKATGDYKEKHKLQPYKREPINSLLEWDEELEDE